MAWTTPTTRTFGELVTASIWNTDLVDDLKYIINSSGNLAIAGSGPHAIGGSVANHVQFLLNATYSPTGSTFGAGLGVLPTLSPEANDDCYGLLVQPTLVEAGSGTHAVFTSAIISAPTITPGAGALTNAFTLFLNGAPSAAVYNACLHIEGSGHDGVVVSLSDATDVTHGVTDIYPTSVYGVMRKGSAADGGLSIQGLTQGAGGLSLIGIATSADTTETTSSRGNITLTPQLKSGTGVTLHAADDDIVVFVNQSSATHIFKGNGDSYEDGTGWTAYDAEDDVALVNGVDLTLDRGLRARVALRADAAQFLAENEEALERLRIVTFNRKTDGRPYINKSRLSMLHNGAIRLLFRTVAELKARLDALERAS